MPAFLEAYFYANKPVKADELKELVIRALASETPAVTSDSEADSIVCRSLAEAYYRLQDNEAAEGGYEGDDAFNYRALLTGEEAEALFMQVAKGAYARRMKRPLEDLAMDGQIEPRNAFWIDSDRGYTAELWTKDIIETAARAVGDYEGQRSEACYAYKSATKSDD